MGFFSKQNTHEALKLMKNTWNEFPVKNLVKKRYYKGIYVKFSHVTTFLMAQAAILDFRKNHVPLLENYGTFDRSLKITIWMTPKIFSLNLILSIFALEYA